MKKSYMWIGIVAILLFAAVMYVRLPKGTTTMSPQSKTAEPSMTPEPTKPMPPAMEIDVKKKYTATMQTSAGPITIVLTAAQTPITVNNFVHLSRTGFYTNSPFHRTMKGFMIQGGDPKGTGTGGPGYAFDDEPFTGEYLRGTVAMANAGPDTNGSQFFIMHADYALSPDYVIFGKVTEGMETVDAIATAPTIQDGRENSKPVTPVTIQSINIVEQ